MARLLCAGLLLAAASAGWSCRRQTVQSYGALLESGSRYLEKKDFPRAVIQFKAAARLSPKSPEAYYRLGLAYLGSNNMLEAVPVLVKAAEIDPKHEGAQVKLAELLAGSSDKTMLGEGRKRLQEILSTRPGNPEALTVLGLTEARLGEAEDAEKHLLAALQEAPGNLKASAVLARIKLAQNDPAGAETVLRTAVEQAGGSLDARLVLAEFYLYLNRSVDAEQELRAAISIDSQNTRALLGLAAVYAMTGKKQEAGDLYRRISGMGNPRYKHLYGAFLYSDGRREEAVREFERIAREDPEDREARARLVAAYLAANRNQNAERLLDSALERNPKDADALLLRSEMQIRSGNYAEAQKNLVEILRYKPESASAHHLLAKTYAARGNSRLERQELAQALQLRPDLLEARIELARSHLEANAPRQTLEVLEGAPPSQRQGLAYVVLRNHALLTLGEYEECARGVVQALARGRMPDLLVQDAELKLIHKQYAAARASAQEALSRDPEHIGALGVLYRSMAAEKGVSAALEGLRRYASVHPELSRVQAYVGERLLANGRLTEARGVLARTKTAGSASPEVELALARLDLLEGNLEGARRTISRLVAGGHASPTVLFLAATVENQAGEWDAAIENYRGVLAADPNHVSALTNLAYLLAEHGQSPEQALPFAQKAMELDPVNVDAGGVLGYLYYRRGLYATALQQLGDAVTKDRTARSGGAAFRKCYLGLTYLKLGDRARGVGLLRAALEANLLPKDAQIARAAIADTAKTSGP